MDSTHPDTQGPTVLSLRDTADRTLEEQLPILIHSLEIAEAEADWFRKEQLRRSEIRQTQWEEVKAEAFTKLTYQRNAELLCDQLERREAAATMRAYAAEVEARAEQLDDPDAEDARELSAPPFLKLRSTRDPAVRGRKPKIATQ